jgi:hypothetical protein
LGGIPQFARIVRRFPPKNEHVVAARSWFHQLAHLAALSLPNVGADLDTFQFAQRAITAGRAGFRPGGPTLRPGADAARRRAYLRLYPISRSFPVTHHVGSSGFNAMEMQSVISDPRMIARRGGRTG